MAIPPISPRRILKNKELQKSDAGAISKVSFASQKAVTDKTGNYGVPIVIELMGSWDAIDSDLQKIDKLPYLFRPVKVEIGYDEENLDEENPKNWVNSVRAKHLNRQFSKNIHLI